MRRYVDDSIEESGSYNYVTIILDYRVMILAGDHGSFYCRHVDYCSWGVQDPKE